MKIQISRRRGDRARLLSRICRRWIGKYKANYGRRKRGGGAADVNAEPLLSPL
jgi:hypothetical protein